MTRVKFQISVFSVLLTFFLSGMLTAQEDMKVYVLQSEPLGYRDSQGSPTGEHWDYMQAISKRSGIPMSMKIAPKARIFSDIKNGNVDAAIFFRSKKRDNVVEYAGLIRQIKIVAINHKGVPLSKFEDLYNSSSIGIVRNTFYGENFDNNPKIRKSVVSKYDNMIPMFGKGRIDTATGNAIVLTYLLKKHNLSDQIELPGISLGEKEQWLQVSKQSKHLDKLQLLSQTIEELKRDGTFDEILTRHVGPAWKVINKL